MKWVLRLLGISLLGIVWLATAAWGALAIYYSDLEGEQVRTVLAGAFAAVGALTLAGSLVTRLRRAALATYVVAFVLLLAWWLRIAPSNERDWQTDVTVLPYATIDGDLVTIHNIRNFDYRSETDFTPRYYDKTFDLKRLDTVDLIACYWMGDAIAHIMLSFGFGGDDHVAFSIETRKERGEAYSTIAGFFKQYELFYVVGDERDLVRLRTNYRQDPPEDVYVYRVKGPLENARRLFMDYVREINSLVEHPEFYNTATTNCTTNVLMHTRVNPGSLPWSWKILLSGYTPQYVYEQGRLDTRIPFDELRRRSRVNDAARAADDAADFSQRIRIGLP